VYRLGFSLVPERPADLEPEDLTLQVECPFCGAALSYPGAVRGGELPLGECDRCDVYFDVEPDDVFAAALAAE
jgi:hypothetical protein